MKPASDIKSIIEEILRFRNGRDWEKFHDGRNLAISLNVEASELLELFLWKQSHEIDVDKLEAELADVFYAAFLIADKYGLDVKRIVRNKLRKNAKKYPISKFKGSNRKYDES